MERGELVVAIGVPHLVGEVEQFLDSGVALVEAILQLGPHRVLFGRPSAARRGTCADTEEEPPPVMALTDVAATASVPIWRFQVFATITPNSTVEVASARAPSQVKHSRFRWPPRDTPARWSKTQTASKPACSARSEASRRVGQSACVDASWTSMATIGPATFDDSPLVVRRRKGPDIVKSGPRALIICLCKHQTWSQFVNCFTIPRDQ